MRLLGLGTITHAASATGICRSIADTSGGGILGRDSLVGGDICGGDRIMGRSGSPGREGEFAAAHGGLGMVCPPQGRTAKAVVAIWEGMTIYV